MQQPQVQKPLAHSFSSLEQFDTCPYKYYRLRIKKDVKEVDGPESEDGKRKHKALEDRLRDGTPLPPDLKKHEDKCATLLNSGMVIKPEEELAITKELIPCEWWHRDAFLRVKADVGLYTETTAGLLDWKTGKRKPKPFQLELGAMAQWIHYPKIKSTKAAFLWLKDDVSDPYTYTRKDDYDRILAKFKAKVQRIEEAVVEDVWQPKPGYHCNWCPASDTCSASQAKDKR